MYYATDGDIYVNGTVNKNTANETGGGGTVRFQEVGTNVWQTGTTRGQIIGTRLSQRYGGPQYYISDGRGGYDSMDHFNIHGNTNMTPSFTGQFGYDPRSKKVKFAVGNSNINDWVEFANSDTVEAAKTSLTSLVNTTKDTLTQTVNTTLTTNNNNIAQAKRELTDLINSTAATLRNSINDSVNKINEVKNAIAATNNASCNSIIDWDAYKRSVGNNDIYTWVGRSGMNLFTDKRRWREGDNWCSVPVNNWTQYDEIVFAVDDDAVYTFSIRVPILKKLLNTSYYKVAIGDPAFRSRAGLSGVDIGGLLELVPMIKDTSKWNHNYALTTNTKLSFYSSRHTLYAIYGIKYGR